MANYPMKTRKSSKFREREDEKKELQDLADTPPSMLSEGERFRLFGKTTKPLDPTQRAEPKKEESFEERMRKADPAQRKYMLAKGGFVRAADGIAKRGKTKGKML
jgi:hypothetical protein